MPWRENMYQHVQKRPLVIGFMIDDGIVKVHPPVERIVRAAATKLQDAGHSIVPWSPEGHAECIDVMVSSILAYRMPALFIDRHSGFLVHS